MLTEFNSGNSKAKLMHRRADRYRLY